MCCVGLCCVVVFFRSCLRSIFNRLGGVLGRLLVVLAGLRGVLGASWGILEGLGAVLGGLGLLGSF